MIDKDCIFLLADKQMELTFRGFLEKNNFHLNLGSGPFTFGIRVHPGHDPGVFTNAPAVIAGERNRVRYAIVALDYEWSGAPRDAENIRTKIKDDLVRSGWRERNVEVVVIKPELEVWLWQDSIHIPEAFHFNVGSSIKMWLREQGYWQLEDLKPERPKDAFRLLGRASGIPPDGAIYKQIASKVSIRGCIDPAFCLLRDTLQRWFPASGGE